IINNHVFSDGNKRTGLGAALLFLRINGYKLKGALLDENSSVNSNLSRQKQLEKITLLVASGRMSQEQLQKWFERNIEPIENN
ncbi:MAG: type II toxin-antitoxin system death-on-curing family toxin, partial [Bacteroidota bacterium]